MTHIIGRIGRELRRFGRRVKRRRTPCTLEGRMTRWMAQDQPFELEFHQHDNYRWNDGWFDSHWQAIFARFMGFTRDSFGDNQILFDLGCGSRPCLDWFTGECRKYHLDPLLNDYLTIKQVRHYWEGKPTRTLLSQPAEQFVSELAGECDFVNCWNVLDHTYDWRAILENIRRYLRPGGTVCLGTDFKSHGLGHPGIDDPGYFFRFIETHFDVLKQEDHYADREIALRLSARAAVD